MERWGEYMKSMGLGYKLGIELGGEKGGVIGNGGYYEKGYKG